MNKRSDDYIPYESELIAEHEAAALRAKNAVDPRHEYIAEYKINGTALTERIFAYDVKSAEEHIRQQLALVGWFPTDFKLSAVGETNVDVG